MNGVVKNYIVQRDTKLNTYVGSSQQRVEQLENRTLLSLSLLETYNPEKHRTSTLLFRGVCVYKNLPSETVSDNVQISVNFHKNFILVGFQLIIERVGRRNRIKIN